MSRALALIGKSLKSFGLFWWDFIVGDDITIALGVVAGLAGVAGLHAAGAPAWWSLPVLWVLALVVSLVREVRRTRRSSS